MDRLTIKTCDGDVCYEVKKDPEGAYDILDLAKYIDDGDGEEANILTEISSRLAAYEDIGLTPEEIKSLVVERTALFEELDNAQPCFACAGFNHNGGKCWGAGHCRVRDVANFTGVPFADRANGESWRWRGADGGKK